MSNHWENILAILSFFWPYAIIVIGFMLPVAVDGLGVIPVGGVLLLGGMLRIIFRELDHI